MPDAALKPLGTSATTEVRALGTMKSTSRSATSKGPRFLMAVVASILATGSITARSDGTVQCSDILYLIEQSKSQFIDIQRDAGSDFGDYKTSFVLPGTWYCAILEDVEKRTYKCTWKHPLGGQQSRDQFQGLVDETRQCISHMASEKEDRLVNHPDFYAARYYQFPGGEARVTIKDKSRLESTLVSIVIDGFSKPK